jgi:hypothetical protein
LIESYLPNIPTNWLTFLGKGGKEIQEDSLIEKFAKANKKTKLKLLFCSHFGQLSPAEKEQRLNGLGCTTAENTTDNTTTTTSNEPPATSSLEPEIKPETKPDSYIIAVSVVVQKKKHVLYFTNPEEANIGGLRQRISAITGVQPTRQRLIINGKVIGMGMNAKQVDNTETLLSLSKNKKKLKIKLLFDAKHHHSIASTVTLQDVNKRLVELEKIINGMHRKMSHRLYDQAQMIINGRNFDHEIKELEKSVNRLPNASKDVIQSSEIRVTELKRLNEEIADMMLQNSER